MNNMEIEYISVKDLVPYENNPRHNDDAVEYVANSIKEFGFKVPVVIDDSNTIITGHTRLKAALQLGLDKIPCIRANDLSETQIKAFRIADNKVSEFATWDLEKLDIELEDIELDMTEFGLLETEPIDIDDFFEEVETSPEDSEEEETITCPYCGKEFTRS